MIKVEINSQKNCAQNKALQKCESEIFAYFLVERDEALSERVKEQQIAH